MMDRVHIRAKLFLLAGLGFLVLAAAEYMSIRSSILALERAHGESMADTAEIMLKQMNTMASVRLDELARLAARRDIQTALLGTDGENGPRDGPRDGKRDGVLDNKASSVLKEEFLEAAYRISGRTVFFRLLLTNRRGDLVATTEPGDPVKLADRDWWRQTRDHGHYIGASRSNDETNPFGLIIAVRLNAPSGRMIGVARAELSSQWIMREALSTTRSQQYRDVQLVTREGRLLFANTPFQMLKDISRTAPWRAAHGQRGFVSLDKNGRTRLYAYSRAHPASFIGSLGWTLILGSDGSVVLADAYTLQSHVLMLLGVFGVTGVLITLLISRGLVLRILAMRDAAMAMADGDLTPRARTQGDDELTELANAFNVMAERQQDYTDRLRRLNVELEQKRTDAEAADRAKSEFLANMSHEIRTPMNAVLGLTYLAGRTRLDEQQRDLIDKIGVSARSLLGILDDILDFSKIEAGRLDIVEERFSLTQLFADLGTIMSVNSNQKDLELAITADPSIPRWLLGDDSRLQQILVNITGNAIKFTEKGLVAVYADMASRSEDRVEIQFSVQDTGIGMTPDQQKRLFHSFSQADPTTTRRFGGTGLGLAISHRLVTMMGGTEIQVDSVAGQGSRFWFRLPFSIPRSEPARTTAPAPRRDQTPLSLLVVDDNAIARESLLIAIRALGWRSHIVGSGMEALAHVVELRSGGDPGRETVCYDACLVDWDMPGLDGLETSRRLRALSPAEAPPILLMATGFGRETLAHLPEIEALIDGFLTKPITGSALYDAVLKCTAKHSGASPECRRWKTDGVIAEKDAGRSVAASKALAGLRVLVAEDNEINRQVAQSILEQEGAEVRVVGDGHGAIAEVKDRPDVVDLVLMDVQMPGMDGFEATRRIRKMAPDLPILALTAGVQKDDRDRCLACGMNDFVSKPLDVDVLLQTILRLLPPRPPVAEVDASPPVKAAPASAVPDDLPADYPGFDPSSALRRLGGDHALLRRLLKRLQTQTQQTTLSVRRDLEAGALESAVGSLHALRGAARTVGAEALATAAGDLELAITDDPAFSPSGDPSSGDTAYAPIDYGDLLARLEETEQACFQALTPYLAAGPAAAPVDMAMDEKEIARLLDLLEKAIWQR